MGLELFSRELCLGSIFSSDIDHIWPEFCFIPDTGYLCVCDHDQCRHVPNGDC